MASCIRFGEPANATDKEEEEEELLFVGINQDAWKVLQRKLIMKGNFLNTSFDNSCFSVGTNHGFKILSIVPYRENSRRDFIPKGGFSIVTMLYRTNILALVGTGKNINFPNDRVIIWDDNKEKPIGSLSYKSEVKAVYLRKDVIVVVLSNKVYIYNLADLTLKDHIETIGNPLGLCAVSSKLENNVIAVPGLLKGHLHIELYTKSISSTVPAHETDLAAIGITLDGCRVATASEKGTLIRVFDTETGQQLHELRRGLDKAIIYCLAFDRAYNFIACTSDKGTCHIYALNELSMKSSGGDGEDGGEAKSPESVGDNPPPTSSEGTLGFLKGYLPKYFSSVTSTAQIRGAEGKSICAFTNEPSTIAILCADGSFFTSNFAKGGECEKTFHRNFRAAKEEEKEKEKEE